MIREEFLRLLREDEAFREEVRRQILTDDLLAVPDRLGRLEALLQQTLELQRQTLEAVRAMASRMAEFAAAVEARFDRVEARLDGVEARLDGVEARLDRVERDVGDLKRDVGSLKQGVGDLKGRNAEEFFLARARGLLGEVLRVRTVSPAPEWLLGLKPRDRRRLAQATDLHDLLQADLVADARTAAGQPVLLVGEVSWTAEPKDVERAQRRADVLRRLGFRAVPSVFAFEIPEAVAAEAEASGVLLVDRAGPRNPDVIA